MKALLPLLLFALVGCIFAPAGYGQTADSAYIADAFTKAIVDAEHRAEHLQSAKDKLSKNKSAYLKDIYAYWNARYHFSIGQIDQADSLVQLSIHQYDTTDVRAAKFYNIKGSIASVRRDYKGAIKNFQRTIAIYEKNDNEYAAAFVKSNIGNIFLSLTDYESSYKYIYDAYETVSERPDSMYYPVITGILSVVESKLGMYNEARKHADQALKLSEAVGHAQGMSLAYYALGEIYLEARKLDEAVTALEKGLQLAEAVKDANMSHLSKVLLLSVHTERDEYRQAVNYGEQALTELHFLPNKTTEYSICKNLSVAYAGLKNYERAYSLARTADSVYKATSNLKNKEYINDLLIRYETEKKEVALKIEQQENLTNEAQIRKQGWFLLALGVSVLFLISLFFVYRNTQRLRMRQLALAKEREVMHAVIEGEEKERERIAHELHDGLASDLTGIKLLLSQQNTSTEVIEALTRAHEQTRRISHNLSPVKLEQMGLVQALNSFMAENQFVGTALKFYSNADEVHLRSSGEEIMVFRMCQEIIQNALKHANASEIMLQMIAQQNQLSISIEDDGKGFDPASVPPSFGLMHLRKQTNLLSGSLEIDSHPGRGTVVFLTLPLK